MAITYKFNNTETGDAKHHSLLFLHGFLGSSGDWQDVISFFADDFYCLALDLPGHGKTVVDSPKQNYSMERVASGLVEFLESKDLRKWNMIAYSMGGRLALYMAVHYPDRFNRILLESASPGLEHLKERQLRLDQDAKLAERLESIRFKDFLREWYEQPLFVSLKKDKDKFEKLLNERLKNDKKGLNLSLKYMSTGVQPKKCQSDARRQKYILLKMQVITCILKT